MNTTFTNYAEKKAKQILNLLQGYTKGIRITAILILLLMGVSNAWAGNNIAFQNGANFYFDPYYNATQTVNKGTIQLAVRKYQNTGGYDYGWYTGVTTLTNIENTRLYYASKFEGPSWNDDGLSFHGWAMISNGTAKSNSTTEYWTGNNSAWYSEFKNYGLNNGSTYLFVATSASNGQSIEPSGAGYLSGGYSDLNYTQTIKTAVNGADANSKAAITVTSYNLTGNGTISSQKSASISTSTKSTTISAARTATTTLTVGTVATGYQFDGWYTAATGGTKLSTSTTYTYYPTAATTVYARFSAKKYAITYKDQNNANFSGTHASGYPTTHTYGTATTLKTATKTGYTFDGWHTDAACTNKVTSLGATAYTADITLYAEWTATPTIIYLKPNSNWKKDGARFAIYYWGDEKSDGWVEMIAIGDCNNEYYKAELPAGYTDFKFVRLKPSNADDYNQDNSGLNWDNKWNETGDLSKQNNGDNCFTIDEGQWGNTNNGGEGASGSWSTYSDEYSANLEINRAGGTVTINNEPYTTTSSLPKVTLGSTFTINSITVKENYKFKKCTVTMGGETYTPTTFPVEYKICGPITVTVEYASVYTVTFNKNGHGTAPDDQKVESGMTASEPSMQDADGYLFAGWYTTANCTTKFDFSTKINANKTLYAKWVAYENCVFFKNTLGWSNVYVYTFNEDVWKENGVRPNPNDGGKILEFAKMTQLGMSDIYYFVMTKEPNNYTQDNNSNKNYIAFSDIDMSTFYDFHETNAIYRGDHKKNLTLFIPQKDQTPEGINYANYYSKGIWMKYNSTESGYQLPDTIPNDDPDPNHDGWGTWGNKFESETKGGYTFSITKTLEANRDYEFKIKNYVWFTDWENKANNEWFGNDGKTITEDNCTGKHFHDENDKKHSCDNAKITTTEAGDYTFHIYLGDGKVILSVDYPVGKDSYRLAYKDNQKNFKPGHKILKSTKAEELDTVSFFVRRNASPHVKLQKFTSGKWSDVVGWQPVTVTADSVYNFVMKQTNQGASGELLMNQTHLYTGKYYIRTNSVDGGWVDFRRTDHEMTYTSYADKHEDFDHYFCKWIESGDLTYTVANDYSYCISDTLTDDSFTNNDGTLKAKASVRFGWDSHTNDLRRAYLSGSSHVADRFLVLIGKDDNLKDKDGNKLQIDGMNANETNFADLQNWIYQVDVKANKNTKVKLTAHYDGKIQYFAGNAEGANEYVQLISSDAEKTYPIRIIYDFKTNHLVAAWTMEGNQTITNDDILGTNMMIIRTDHEQAEQLTFNPAAKQMSQVDTVYAVMSFSDGFIKDDSKSINERAFYWVSFPFDVQISDVFGFGEYAEHWIMQEYDGESRAKYGLFEDSGTYWKYIYDTKTVLTRGKGYVLTLDVDKVKNSFVHNIDKVSLYFPSKGNIGTITGEVPTNMEVPHHLCTINMPDATLENRRDRRIYDSHWNIIGVPAFADVSQFETSSDNAPLRYSVDSLSFYYEYVPAKDNYRTRLAGENKTDGTHAGSHKRTFQAMYGYMVQFAGHLNWSAKSPVIPDQLAARRNGESELPEKVVLGLELVQGEEKADQTFVQLQQEGATTNFDMNIDLTKIINSGANIYTLTNDRIQAAGNALPMEESVVPVGVQIAAEGEYTFRMPNGTEGMVVELIDYETNTRTNLLLDDYTITLSAGSYENRFALDIQPQKDVVTSLENIGENGKVKTENGKPNKYLIDGKLIIRTAEGVVYDAQGKRL